MFLTVLVGIFVLEPLRQPVAWSSLSDLPKLILDYPGGAFLCILRRRALEKRSYNRVELGLVTLGDMDKSKQLLK